MSHYWEAYLFLSLLMLAGLVLVLMIAYAWYQDRRRWHNIPRHIGSTYDASDHSTEPPRISIRRTR